MGLKNLILKENPTPGGGTKYVPRGIVLLIVIGAAIGFAIYKGTHSASESVKQTIDKMEKVEATISQRIANEPSIAANLLAKKEEEQKKRKDNLELSLKRNAETPEQAEALKKKQQALPALQWQRANDPLDTPEDTPNPAAKRESLEDMPLWTRLQQGGPTAANITTANALINPTLDPAQRNVMGPNPPTRPGGPAATNQYQDATFGGHVAYIQQNPSAANPATNNNDAILTDHFLPTGYLIPVVFVTGVNTSSRLNRTGAGSTTQAAVTGLGNSSGGGQSSTAEGSGGGGSENQNLVIVQVARPTIAQHRLQLTTRTRLLCKVTGDALTENEDVSRIFLTAERILFPDGSELPLNGASFIDARDKERGVLAERIVPSLWKRLIPIAIARFGAGVLQASAGTTYTGIDAGRPYTTRISSGIEDGLRQGGADALTLVTDTYLNRILDENQPYSRITPGAIGFIMIENPVDITLTRKAVAPRPQKSVTPIVQNKLLSNDDANTLIQQYRSPTPEQRPSTTAKYTPR